MTDSDSEMKAIHHAGTPAAPPVSIAVSLPPPSSAPIKPQPQFPRSVTPQHERALSSSIVASVFTSSSTKGRKDSVFFSLSISKSTSFARYSLTVPFSRSSEELNSEILTTNLYSPSSQSSIGMDCCNPSFSSESSASPSALQFSTLIAFGEES